MELNLEKFSSLEYNLPWRWKNMENMKCVLVTEDKNYGELLSRCLRRAGSTNITICSVIDKVEIYDYIIVDMETVNKSKYDEICKLSKKDTLCIKMLGSSVEKEDEYSLLKYEPLSKWISKAIKIYAKERGQIFINPAYQKKTKVISLISSAGGMGATSIAMAVASDFSFCGGKKVMYLSLKSQCQELQFFHKKDENDFRTFLYRRHMEGEELAAEDFMSRNQYGVYSFNISNIENPLKYLKKEHLENFFRKIITEDDFDIIVFDIGTEISHISRLAIGLSDRKIFLSSKEKDEYFQYFLKECSYNKNSDFLVENFAYPASKFDEFFEDDEDEDEEMSEKIKIVEDLEAFQMIDGIKNFDLNSSFGISIRNLINFI